MYVQTIPTCVPLQILSFPTKMITKIWSRSQQNDNFFLTSPREINPINSQQNRIQLDVTSANRKAFLIAAKMIRENRWQSYIVAEPPRWLSHIFDIESNVTFV